MIAEADNISTTRVRDSRSRAKYTKQLFAQLRARFKPQQSGGLSHILIPDTTDTTSEAFQLVTNPTEVETCILQRNITHFGQAHGTLFTIPPLREFLNYDGVTPHAQQIINGANITQIKTGSSPAVQNILNKLNDGNNLALVSTKIVQSEFMSGMRRWKESTSTSPSGRHLGHYKVLGFPEQKYTIDEVNIN